MMPTSDVRKIASARLWDARLLHLAFRYDGAFYMAGYAVELGLKAAICDKHAVSFPESDAEFRTLGLGFMKNHVLQKLLLDSGRQASVLPGLLLDWSVVVNWNVEQR